MASTAKATTQWTEMSSSTFNLARRITALSTLFIISRVQARSSSLNLAKSIVNDPSYFSNRRRRAAEAPTFLVQHRRFGVLGNNPEENVGVKRTTQSSASASVQACDAAFIDCIPHEKCITCYSTMETEEIDWTNIVPETPCVDVVDYLSDAGYCKNLKYDAAELDVFCNTFNSCIVWDEDYDDYEDRDSAHPAIDCDSLEKCEWEGMHVGFLGDGVCNDSFEGCYNHKVCGYDKGDCCEDTCKSTDYVNCGDDGYACRDPGSSNCNPILSLDCPRKEGGDGTDKKEDDVKCGPDQVMYRLNMFDSWGDGWDETTITITPKNDAQKVIFHGGLEDKAEGTVKICLAREPTCYSAVVAGGVWGNEVSWEIKPSNAGAPPLAEGGAPDKCEFSVGGETCLKSCDGKPDTTIRDPDYKSFKDMSNCIDTKCILLFKGCDNDPLCVPCLGDVFPEYCYSNENYGALVDCTLCNCAGDETPLYCEEKAKAGTSEESSTETSKETGQLKQCSADQTAKGSKSVMKFHSCSDIDSLSAIITNYDENNFGDLDAFEECAHKFTNEPKHDGKNALDCMRILFNAKEKAEDENDKSGSVADSPVFAIAALATHLYEDAESFCDCASESNKDAPMCVDFIHFKTLLMESLDACQSLDEIDCDAWDFFYKPCKDNLMTMFNEVNFGDPRQCEFAKNGCGGVGPFPAFRKLDCGHEISKASWDFYNLYSRGCLGSEIPGTPNSPAPLVPSTPVTPATQPNAPATKSPTPAPTKPLQPKPYYSPPDDDDTDARDAYHQEDNPKKKSHLWVILPIFGLVGVGYWYQKHRSDTFDFMQYRHRRNYGGGASYGDYSGLSMDGGSSSFEPPTLPPPPSAMDTQMI